MLIRCKIKPGITIITYPTITISIHSNPILILPRRICPQPGIKKLRKAAVPGSMLEV